jgi:Ca-activated chloride channel family protein
LSFVDKTWKLEELASESGVSARTVRYYVQRGLLPAPVFRGRDTAYSEEHLVRLRAIRRLQERFLPLDAIQAELERSTPDELRRLAVGQHAPPPVTHHPYRQPPLVPPRPAPAPGQRWIRFELAPGLELHLLEGADATARALCDQLRTMCEKGK